MTDGGGRLKHVVVKTWDFFFPRFRCSQFIIYRFHDEIKLHMNPLIEQHPCIPKLIGFCCEKKLMMIYGFGAEYTVHQLLASDDFVWWFRMKAICEFAKLIQFFHDNHILVGDIDAKFLLIDEAYYIKMFDYIHLKEQFNQDDVLEGGEAIRFGPFGYRGPEIIRGADYVKSKYYMKSDIYGFGILLLHLIAKRSEDEDKLRTSVWVSNKLNENISVSSFVHPSLREHAESCVLITKLVKDCIKPEVADRPNIGDVVQRLENAVGL